MKKFHLDIYKETRQYLYLYDVLMKDEIINKDYFLADLGINPGSYRRAKVTEQKIGKEIVEILARKFELSLVNTEEVDELEELANNVFYEINYKDYDNYEEYLLKIDFELKKNNLLFPIFLLLKLFLLLNTQNSLKDTIEDNRPLFNELKKFKKFFNNELLEIYEYLTIVYSENIKKELANKKYSNGLSYSIIATKLFHIKSYYESLYFAQRAKLFFLSESNYKRVIYTNFTILNNLSFVLDFDEYYKLAHEQLHTLKSFGCSGFELNSTIKHLVVSSLALNKYKEVIKILENKEEVTITEMFCLIIAKYNYDPQNFEHWFKEEMNDLIADEEYKELINDLLLYLKEPEKKNLLKLKDYEIMSSLINILKCL